MKKIVFILLFCSSSTIFADASCDASKDSFDDLYCLNNVYLEAVKELNTHYKKLNSRLDIEGKKMLKTSHLLWIDSRNSNCSKQDATGLYVNLNCATSYTIQRSQFLQDRIHECIRGACQNNKL